jgi:hypothetical protein
MSILLYHNMAAIRPLQSLSQRHTPGPLVLTDMSKKLSETVKHNSMTFYAAQTISATISKQSLATYP